MKPSKNQWRTVGIAALGIVVLGLVAWASGRWTGVAAVYPAFAAGVIACVGFVAGKALGEHHVNAKADAAKSAEPAA